MPKGEPQTELGVAVGEGRSVVFTLPGNTVSITLRLDDSNVMHLTMGTGGVASEISFTAPASPARAPALEDADRAFSADVGKRGVDGWVAAFEPTGWMLEKDAKVSGAAIGEMMKPVLESGTLAWAPVASGVRDDVGFTVGTATFTGKTPADSWRSSYITIWAKQPDGAWKVRFDTGRPINE